MKQVPSEAAEALMSLRNLLLAVCRERSDGARLLDSLRDGGLRIVLDETAGVITIGVVLDEGVWTVETVDCHPGSATFGSLHSGGTTTH
jgi:hypothetical protein